MVESISVLQALLIGLIGGLAIISWIYTFFTFNRALIISTLVGSVLGFAKEAIIFGAAAELIYLGLINAAGVVPPNSLGPGLFGTVILLTNENVDVGTAITLSMPFAIFVQFLMTSIFTISSPFGAIGQRLIEKEHFLAYRITSHITGILLFVMGFTMGLAAGLGYEAFGKAIQAIPVWLQEGLGMAGGLLPAMGFAVVLRLMLKKEYIPFVLTGFTLVVIFQGIGAAKPEWGFSLVALAISAIVIALIVFNSGILSRKSSRGNEKEQGASNHGI